MSDTVEKVEEVVKVVDSVEITVEPVKVEESVKAEPVEPVAKPVEEPVKSLTESEESKENTAVTTGLELLKESLLTDEQKKLAITAYESVKEAVKEVISDPNLNSAVKITKIIGQTIKQLESVKGLREVDKKAITIQLGRVLITEAKSDIDLSMYDVVAEQTVNALIEVSNIKNIPDIKKKCGNSLLRFIRNLLHL